MDYLARFGQYAAAFEEDVEDDDWKRLEPFFTEDAVYETIGEPFAGRHEGRSAAFGALKASLDSLDRRFTKRTLEILKGPELSDGGVWLRWRVTYGLEDAPDLTSTGEELCEFEGDRIRQLTDRFDAEGLEAAVAWMSDHGGKLGLG